MEEKKMNVMLAKEFEKGMNGAKKDTTKYAKPPLGWISEEKWDGYRALFFYNEEGKGTFLSRAGKEFFPPEWFLEAMPHKKLLKNKILDGELWAGRENFQLMGTVRKKIPVPEEWIDIQFVVFDITNNGKPFKDRIPEIKNIVRISKERWLMTKKSAPYPYHNLNCPIVQSQTKTITSMKMMDTFYNSVIQKGGEGIMLKHPEALYENGRSSNLLKYKPSFDRESIIIDYKPGKGKYTGKLGGFVCRPLINHDTYMTIDEDDNHIFTLSGMDDSIRGNYEQTHPRGTIITYECSGFTDKGIPRFGRYLRKRVDVVLKETDMNSSEKLNLILTIFGDLEKHFKNKKDMFRARSYSKVLPGLKKLEKDSDLTEENFKNIPGLGKGLKDKIRTILDTGSCPDYDFILQNKKELSIHELFQKIHGVGPSCSEKLVQSGFKTIEDLQKCKNIRKYLNEVQIKGLTYYNDINQRIPYNEIVLHEKFLKDTLSSIDPSAELTIAGSYRRKKETSGDIDVLLKSKDSSTYQKLIEELKEKKYIQETLSHGPKKFMGMSTIDMKHFKCTNRRIDIMYTTPEEYPFAVLYFTGSKDFNVTMRSNLLEKGFTLNEYGVEYTNGEKIDKKFKKEKDIFKHFGYKYVQPEKR